MARFRRCLAKGEGQREASCRQGQLRILDGRPQRHYEMASALFRDARSSGVTVRRLIDCLIAAVAIDHDAILLHADRDFDGLTRTSALRVDL
ncbi:MAG: PIN domain-containing protein [Candidatus Nanopelagicales bacterium]